MAAKKKKATKKKESREILEFCDRSCHWDRDPCVNEGENHRIHRCEIHAGQIPADEI